MICTEIWRFAETNRDLLFSSAIDSRKDLNAQMSYATRVEEMVAKHVGEFQRELSLAKTMHDSLDKPCPMPYGYPLRVWCPHHVCCSPRVKRFIPQAKGRMSNGIPAILRLRIADDYVMGLYNPRRH